LHRELQMWIMNSGYQLQEREHRPVWRMHNTSLTLATGTGMGTYFLLKRFRPKAGLPLLCGIPTVAFYLAYRSFQFSQLGQLYDSLLVLPTPLGIRAREILSTLRNGDGRLPSDEYGARARMSGASAAAATSGARQGAGSSTSEESNSMYQQPASDETWGGGRPATTAGGTNPGGWDGFGGHKDSTLQPPQTPVADPWAIGGSPFDADEAWPKANRGDGVLVPGRQRPVPHTTWDEIRARRRQEEGG